MTRLNGVRRLRPRPAFLRALACHIEWHVRRRLAAMIHGQTLRDRPPPRRNASPPAIAKQPTGRIDHGLPVHVFLIGNLALPRTLSSRRV